MTTGTSTRQVPQARQILRKLLPSPLRFTPHGERVKGYFEFEGQAALGRLLFGAAGSPSSVASPRRCARVGVPETFVDGNIAA